jgi:hypothetical protein
MFKNALTAALIALAPLGLAAPAMAESAPAPAAPAAAAKFSTGETTIGDLIDNAATKAVLEKHMPGFATNPQVEMARGFTLRAIQAMVPDQIKAETLDLIDADLAKL